MQFNIPTKKTDQQIKSYLTNGPIFGQILLELYNLIKLGWFENVLEIENKFKELIIKEFGPSTIFPFVEQTNAYHEPFGKSICVSINDEVAHSRPRDRRLELLDIISIDAGAFIDGLNYDAGFTASRIEQDWARAPLEVLKELTTYQFIKNTGFISEMIERYAKVKDLGTVIALAGHGIGKSLHEAPKIFNAPHKNNPEGVALFDNMCFCIEPIYAFEDKLVSDVYIDSDNWSIKTTSEALATHWETLFYVKDNKIIDVIGITEWI